MTTIMKKAKLLVGASAIALGIGAVAMPASAFDEVNWVWNATVRELITKNVDIDIDIDPTGMVMLEDLQVSIGDITANSTVHGIDNNQPNGGAGGPVEVDLGTITLDADYGLGGAFLAGGTAEGDVVDGTVESGMVDETDVPPDVNGNVTAVIDLGTITVDPEDVEGEPLDAVDELPEIVSQATAVANNTSIEADVAVQLHEAQWAVGDVEIPPQGEDGGGFTWSGVVGVTPANISANSTVYDILNASIDSSATAVANNLTVDVSSDDGTGLVMADVLQVSVANVSATSNVYDISVNNYVNLGEPLGRPLVSSVATAVGNNKSITVSAPDVDVDPTP